MAPVVKVHVISLILKRTGVNVLFTESEISTRSTAGLLVLFTYSTENKNLERFKKNIHPIISFLKGKMSKTKKIKLRNKD